MPLIHNKHNSFIRAFSSFYHFFYNIMLVPGHCCILINIKYFKLKESMVIRALHASTSGQRVHDLLTIKHYLHQWY
jgi:hypothetical protein